MSKISKEEIKKLALMTKLYLKEDEVDAMQQRLNDVLAYAERVQLIAKDIAIITDKNINHDRPDNVDQKNSSAILAQAPAQDDNYFVVPKIVDAE
ncbi:Asp-tRNA(Asn)/Glu-tRNA(Gln) amidotransferase subunit GatC [Candidatus Dependentiae bacterium]|nr:Asp-tRNA(Asn)/Glu-tRNA(Gln) amidotransferase subunit GatC [Candidatus Dependentiae bacterium]